MAIKDDELLLTPEEIVAIVKKHDGDLVQMWNTEVIEGTLTVDSCMNYVLKAQVAKVLKNRLNRPKLREEIAKKIYWWKCKDVVIDFIEWDKLPEYAKEWYRKDADQLLALIPDVEEAKCEIINEIDTKYRATRRSRISDLIFQQGIHISSKDWQAFKRQALKGEK